MTRTCVLTLVVLSFIGCQEEPPGAETEQKQLFSGPYLGMAPPGEVPEIFAPGVVSTVYSEHSGAVFTPDGNELFWTTVINEGREPRMVVVLHMRQVDGVWRDPEIAPFSRGTYTHINSISPDGERLYFYTETIDGDGNTFMAVKTEFGWSEPEPLRLWTTDHPGTHVNEVHETLSGNLYMTGPLESMQGGRGIVVSELADGRYGSYESLGADINLDYREFAPNHSPTIDPDEEFLVFASARPGGFSRQDLYISYRMPDGLWSDAINLGEEINRPGNGNSWPQLSPDGEFLFFVSGRDNYQQLREKDYSLAEMDAIQQSVENGWSNVYWVSTSFVERLRP